MFWYTTSGITTNHLDRKSVCQRKVARVRTSNTQSLHAAVLFLYQQKIMIKMLTLNLFSAHVCVKSITSSNGLL